MIRSRANLPNRCCRQIDRIAHRAFDGEQWMNREGRAATTRNTYCGNLLWQSSLTLLARTVAIKSDPVGTLLARMVLPEAYAGGKSDPTASPQSAMRVKSSSEARQIGCFVPHRKKAVPARRAPLISTALLHQGVASLRDATRASVSEAPSVKVCG